MPLSLTSYVTFSKSLHLSGVLYGQLWDWVRGKEITKGQSGYLCKDHIFEGLVVQGKRFGLCLVGNREPLKGFTEE